MTIAEQIKIHRKAVGLTQEQIAAALNVSTPAVNKWERGVSLPDITLLPALARLLKIDLNTLFSFQETLSEHEIGLFSNALYETMMSEGLAAAFDMAEEKNRDFPRCDLLAYTTATLLNGALTLAGDLPTEEKARYTASIERWYNQAAASDDDKLRYTTIFMLAHRALQGGNIARATELTAQIPELHIDKTSLEIELLLREDAQEAAAEKIAGKILADTVSLQNYFYKLIELSEKVGDHAAANALADLCSQFVSVLGLWPYLSAVPHLLVAIHRQDEAASIRALHTVLERVATPWQPENSPVFCHLTRAADYKNMDTSYLPALVREMETSPEYDFLRDNAEFQALLAAYTT